MTSSRRSNRGGHAKGRKKDEDDDGDQTRCVCKQEHHEGVMIQCETCKVWQHCPCVGLGDGEVTPDKYYCESCRPQNHPYKVQNGVVISSNSKKGTQQSPPTTPTTRAPPTATTKTNPPKKRNTMNSKEATIPMDLLLAQQRWNDEHMDEILDDDIIPRHSAKRRKKNESTTDDEDHTLSKDNDSKDAFLWPSSTEVKAEPDQDSTTKDNNNKTEKPSTSSSPKTQEGSANGRTTPPKGKKSSKAAKSRSSSPTTVSATETRLESSKEDEKTTPTPKAGRPLEEEDDGQKSPPATATSTKKRKTIHTKAEPEEEAAASDQHDSKGEHANSSKSSAADYSASEADRREEPTGKSNGKDKGSRVASPAVTSKKTFPRRGVERNAQRQPSRHSTPVPSTNEGTPQPMAPPAPTAVRYPSTKMTIQDMAKRAKQMLDYISRVQIDMADRKKISSPPGPPAEPAATTPATPVTVATAATAFMLPPAASSVEQHSHEDQDHHDDSRVPDLSRTSMDSTASSMEGVLLHESHQDSSLTKTAVPTVPSSGLKDPMSIKVVPVGMQDLSPLLSTPPLSIHDHHPLSSHHGQDQHRPFNTAGSHEPLTPPHQPLDPTASSVSTDAQDALAITKPVAAMSSLEMMDKLTGDLIRFQEKFGSVA
ncbi:hypothetical protein BGZ83_006672 [Gryganskiella cystojenkinii]|nr:hypothetical protein BGZ83_006672 [Gryganskiella cystojenkinii]